MDKVKQYEKVIIQALEEYQLTKYSNMDTENQLVLDKENNRYILITIGWQGYKHIHSCTLHMDIINGKIWIQSDQTERGIAHRLLELNVPKQDIIIGFYDELLREVSGLGVR